MSAPGLPPLVQIHIKYEFQQQPLLDGICIKVSIYFLNRYVYTKGSVFCEHFFPRLTTCVKFSDDPPLACYCITIQKAS